MILDKQKAFRRKLFEVGYDFRPNLIKLISNTTKDP